MTTIPLVTQPLRDLTVSENAENSNIQLFQYFDDPFTTGQIARFELNNTSLDGQTISVLLFDQEGAGAPATVANFTNYAQEDDYANSIIHRSLPGFIIQGGGFIVENGEVLPVPTDEPVVNEFSPERSNTQGTIAMAKQDGDPNSATSQWFFNLNDNSENLDNQNGGFTVFGEVLSEADFAVVDTIARQPTINVSNVNPAFSSLPVIVDDPSNPVLEGDTNYVRFFDVTVFQLAELEFQVTNNSNPDLVNASVNGGELVLDYADGQNGTAEITVQATDLLGDSIEDTFSITVDDTQSGSDGSDSGDSGVSGSEVYRFLNNDTGVHLYTSSEAEREAIADLPNYQFEGASYVSVDSLTGNPEPQQVYRFLNEDTGTHLYTTSEVEKQTIEDTLSNYSLESESFFAYGEEQPGTIPIYRFFNTETGAHFYTPSQTERDAVLETLPNYSSEDVAYYAFPIEE